MKKASIKKGGSAIIINHSSVKNLKLEINKIVSINRFNQTGLKNYVTIDVIVSKIFCSQLNVERVALPFDTY